MHVPPLARTAIDRDHAARANAGAVAAAIDDSDTRVVVTAGDESPVRDGALARLTVDEVRAAVCEAEVHFSWLGRTSASGPGRTSVVLCASVDKAFAVPGAEWRSLRAVGAEVSDEDAGLFTGALALAQWHRDSGFSPVDGSPLALSESGWVRVGADGANHFPRTDPAVIVAIHDSADERILLGHNAAWPDDRYSLIAGFVDPGESLETAVAREVHEESGLHVKRIEYVASQPWPFPRSLMIGFECVATHPDSAVPDGVEILDVRWFTRDELRSGAVNLPGSASIASWMIAAWLDREPRQAEA